MKLTQNAARGSAAAEPPGLSPLSERLDGIDRRIERLEHAPAALTPAEASGFDRKVMEAVVNAVDVRLKEHAGRVDRAIADLESRMTIELQSLRQQDRDAAAAALDREERTRARFNDQIATLRSGLDDQFAAVADHILAAVRDVMERRIEAAAAAAADSAVDERMDALRADVQAHAGEVADLRQRADENARNVLDLLLALGQICRETAATMSPSPGPRPVEAAAQEKPPAAPDPDTAANHPPETPAPEFGQLQRPRPWRVPLVSSFIVTSGALALGLMRLL